MAHHETAHTCVRWTATDPPPLPGPLPLPLADLCLVLRGGGGGGWRCKSHPPSPGLVADTTAANCHQPPTVNHQPLPTATNPSSEKFSSGRGGGYAPSSDGVRPFQYFPGGPGGLLNFKRKATTDATTTPPPPQSKVTIVGTNQMSDWAIFGTETLGSPPPFWSDFAPNGSPTALHPPDVAVPMVTASATALQNPLSPSSASLSWSQALPRKCSALPPPPGH